MASRKKRAALIIAALYLSALARSFTTFAQIPQPTTPEGHLARSAGAYLGAVEYIAVFKKSECSKFAPKGTLGFDQALRNDVLIAFSPNQREEVRQHMSELKPVLAKQAPNQVSSIISTFKKQERDHNIACSLAANTLAMTLGQALENWRSTKLQYGWRER